MKQKLLELKHDRTNVLFECKNALEKIELLAFLNVVGYVISLPFGLPYKMDDKALFIRTWHSREANEILIDLHIIGNGFCKDSYLFEDFKFDCEFNF